MIRTLLQIEANIDDLNPELYPELLAVLLELGANDAWLTPIIMKHGRPAVTLAVLCSVESIDSIVDAIFRHSSTLGVRLTNVDRIELERSEVIVSTVYGDIAVKIGRNSDGEVLNISPEYSHCKTRAKSAGVPTKIVQQLAIAAFIHANQSSLPGDESAK